MDEAPLSTLPFRFSVAPQPYASRITSAGGTLVSALDTYEHSHHIGFGAKAATYVDSFMDAIRWKSADKSYNSLKEFRGAGQDDKLA
jgi:superoxide dismutase